MRYIPKVKLVHKQQLLHISLPAASPQANLQDAKPGGGSLAPPAAPAAAPPAEALAGPTLSNEAGEYNCFLNVVLQCLWYCAEFRAQVGGTDGCCPGLCSSTGQGRRVSPLVRLVVGRLSAALSAP